MSAEAGHHPNRAYFDQAGNLHLNGASFFNDAEEDVADKLETLGAAAVVAFTQTYSTAAASVPAATTHAITDSTAGTPSTTTLVALADGTTYANDVAALRNNLATLGAEDELIKADILALKKALNSVIDLLQANGLAS